MKYRVPATAGEWGFLTAGTALLVGAQLMFGALTGESAVAFAACWSAVALVGAFVLPAPDAGSLRTLAIPAIGFLVVIVMAMLSLTDFIPGTSQPIWSRLGLPPSASVDRSETLLEIVKLAGLGMTFLVGWGLGERDTTALRAVKVAAYSGAVFAGIAIIMHLAGVGPKTQAGRLEATFLNPNTAGALFGAVLCLNAGLAMRAVRQVRAGLGRLGLLVPLAGCAIAGSALVITYSRGALTATVIALIAMVLARAFARRWSVRRLAMVVGGFVVAAIILFTVSGVLSARFSTVGSDALLRRFIFDSHWKAFTEAPLLGYGLGGFDTVNRMRLTAANYASLWNIRSAENVYLQWLVEGGLLTAIPMFATIGFVCYRASVQTLRRRAMLGPLHALLAVDLVFLLHGIVDFALQTYSIALFWSFLLGLQLALSGASLRRGAPQ